MKTFLLLIFSASFFQIAFSQNKDVEELKKLNEQWIASYPKKDTATLSKIFADDFVLINPIGKKVNKSEAINNTLNQQTVSAQVDSVDVRLLTNDVAIITAYASFIIKENGNDVPGQTCYQDIYMKRKGKWYAVSGHVTFLSPK